MMLPTACPLNPHSDDEEGISLLLFPYIAIENTGLPRLSRPVKTTGRHLHFLNSTCDIGLSDIRPGQTIIVTWDLVFS